MSDEPQPGTPPAPRRRRVVRIAGWIALGLLVAAGGLFAWRYEFIVHHFGEVEAGVLYRSDRPSPSRLADYVADHGIKTVVNLTDDSAEEKAAAERAGARYVANRCDQVPTQEALDRFLAVMDDKANWPVLVHCEHGVGRTGVFCAIYRMEFDGWSAEDAVAEARYYSHWGSFGKTQDKTAYVKSYVPRRARGSR